MKMKTKLLCFVLCAIALGAYAQDKVVTRDLAVYEATILSMNSKGVSCQINGETMNFSAEELSTVTLSNGQVKTYNSPIKGAVIHYPNAIEKQSAESQQEAPSTQTEKYDVIVLNNSDRIDAKIIEVSDSEIRYKKVTNLDGPTYVQKTSDIAAIIYKNGETIAYSTSKNSTNNYSANDVQRTNKKITFQSYIEVGALFGTNTILDDIDKLDDVVGFPISKFIDKPIIAGPAIDIVAGARLNDYVFLGIGLGFQAKIMKIKASENIAGVNAKGELKETMLSLPLYLNTRVYYPKNIKCMPYLDLSIGGNFGLTHHIKASVSFNKDSYSLDDSYKWANGFLLKVGFGIDIKRFSIGVGYQMTRLLGKVELPEYGKIKISEIEDLVQHDLYEHMGYVRVGIKLGKLR